MKIQSTKNQLVRIVQRCAAVADRKSTMPILSNVLITASGSEVTFRATDAILGVAGSVSAEVSSDGSVCVSAHGLLERLKNMPDGDVTLETNSDSLTIKGKGSRKYTVSYIDGADFPSEPSADSAEWIDLDAVTLSGLINRTYFSISDDETRLHMSSALLKCSPGEVGMVTTDGKRVSRVERQDPNMTHTGTFLIPLRGVTELRRILESVDASSGIRIAKVRQDIHFRVDGLAFTVRTPEADFPPYEKAFEVNYKNTCNVDPILLAEAIKAVSVAGADGSAIALGFVKDGIKVEAESPTGGDGSDMVEATVTGSSRIGLDPKFMGEALRACGETVTIAFGDALDAVSLVGEGGFSSIVMPMRL